MFRHGRFRKQAGSGASLYDPAGSSHASLDVWTSTLISVKVGLVGPATNDFMLDSDDNNVAHWPFQDCH